MITAPGYSELAPGAAVTIGLDLSEAVLFSAETGQRLSGEPATAN